MKKIDYKKIEEALPSLERLFEENYEGPRYILGTEDFLDWLDEVLNSQKP